MKNIVLQPLKTVGLAFCALLCVACVKPKPLTLSEQEKREPRFALSLAEVYPGVEASLAASEDVLFNPTNIALDARGRVWVCEAVNYRKFANPQNSSRATGDRILILEDTNGDGWLDDKKVFYEGNDLLSPLGIAVLGNRIFVSCSPNMWVFTDENGDDVPDSQEKMFTGIGGFDHDHALHAVVWGPDGKLYFNFGNVGEKLMHPDGSPVIAKSGNAVNNTGKPYRQGMAFRCDPDGSNLEVLGNNFRNNYELAVSSFGEIFQSDNDDDGNQGVRINYLLEYGNYGYTDELTGAGWDNFRLNMEPEIPLRHWHLNDPGVVPNLLQTGSGSPCGMVVYEGKMLPEVFRSQMIHAEPGHHVVRAYPKTRDGAGYKATIQPLLTNESDDWFRPVDVAVAPDGSLFVADWYDPGVGGHHAGDIQQGRIFRLAAPGAKYKFAPVDTTTLEGAIQALKNPNMATQYLGWQRLHHAGNAATPLLKALASDSDPNLRARALWLLTGIAEQRDSWLTQSLKSDNEEFRALGVRMVRRWDDARLYRWLGELKGEKSALVNKEIALALRFRTEPEADQWWASLANKYQAGDRWSLEALGIASDLSPDSRWKALESLRKTDLKQQAHRELAWRIRANGALPYLSNLFSSGDSAQRLWALRSFEFHPKTERLPYLLTLASDEKLAPENRVMVLGVMGKEGIAQYPGGKAALIPLLEKVRGGEFYGFAVDQLALSEEYPYVLRMALESKDAGQRFSATQILLRHGADDLVKKGLTTADPGRQTNLLQALGALGNDEACRILGFAMSSSDFSMEIRQAAVQAMGSGWQGEHLMIDQLLNGKLPQALQKPAAMRLLTAIDGGVSDRARDWLNNNQGTGAAVIYGNLASLTSDPGKGKAVFTSYCATCHQVRQEGVRFGPALTEIGSKLSPEAMFTAIARPNDGISFGFEGYTLSLSDGSVLSGYYLSKTAGARTLMTMGGVPRAISAAEIEKEEALDRSLMPSGFDQILSSQELADLISYLQAQKTAIASNR